MVYACSSLFGTGRPTRTSRSQFCWFNLTSAAWPIRGSVARKTVGHRQLRSHSLQRSNTLASGGMIAAAHNVSPSAYNSASVGSRAAFGTTACRRSRSARRAEPAALTASATGSSPCNARRVLSSASTTASAVRRNRSSSASDHRRPAFISRLSRAATALIRRAGALRPSMRVNVGSDWRSTVAVFGCICLVFRQIDRLLPGCCPDEYIATATWHESPANTSTSRIQDRRFKTAWRAKYSAM